MNGTEKILAWLKRKQRKQFAISILLAGLCAVAGMGALSLLFCITCAASLMVAPGAMRAEHFFSTWPLLVSSFTVVLLFIDSLHSRRDDLSNVMIWLVRETLGMGPRLLLEGWQLIRRAFRFASLDAESCAVVLGYLANQKRSVSKDELLKPFPTVAWTILRSQLRLIDGVLFLRADFSRVTLTQPLRWILREMFTPEIKATPISDPTAAEFEVCEPEALSSHEILGVSPSASLGEIKLAYRKRIKECHPDRFAQVDQTSRDLAEEWTKALNSAYDELVTQRSRSKQK